MQCSKQDQMPIRRGANCNIYMYIYISDIYRGYMIYIGDKARDATASKNQTTLVLMLKSRYINLARLQTGCLFGVSTKSDYFFEFSIDISRFHQPL